MRDVERYMQVQGSGDRRAVPAAFVFCRTPFAQLAWLLTFVPCALAQTTPPAGLVEDPLAARQQIVRDRLVQLEDRMYRLTEKLRQAEPEQARRLEQALQRSGELLIRHHMDQAIELLGQAELADAVDHQVAAQKALEQILVLLTESTDDTLERQRELDRMRELRQQVDQLLQRQRGLRARTDPEERLADRLAQAAAKVQQLIKRQEKQIEQTRKAGPPEAQALSKSQGGVRESTESVARELDESPAVEPRTDPLPHIARQAHRDLEDAADQMRFAERQLDAGLPEDAQPPQAQALQSLQGALDSLQKAVGSAQPLATPDAARQQKELGQDAGKLADSMEGRQSQQARSTKGDSPESGDQSPGSQPASSPESQAQRQESDPSTPGGDNVRQAEQHMRQAGDKLSRNQPSQATEDQDKAIEQLRQAQAELEETIDQLRREQQEEMLAGLEQRFRTMLLEQKAINTATDELDGRKAGWTRTDSLNLAALSEKETGLSGEAAKALNILVEEGTTVVFPEIVTQVRDDMIDVAGRLGQKQTGEITRGIQAQIVETLEELIAAVEQRQKEGPPPSGGQAGGGQAGEPQLLPGSAELKLLRSCQVRINRQTARLAEASTASAKDIGDRCERLAGRQEQLADMARTINERAEGQ